MAKRNLKISMLAAECSPLAKVGGLADVIGSLPKQLNQLGHRVDVVMPYYKIINTTKNKIIKTNKFFSFIFAGRTEKVEIYLTHLPGGKIKVWLLKNDHYLSNGHVYIKTGRYSNQIRFTFFSLAISHGWHYLDDHADMIHAHDWHTGLAVKLLKESQPSLPILYTIHNLSVQGDWPVNKASKYIDKEDIIERDLKNGYLNPMKLGILYSSAISTVSPTYAKEIMSKNFSEGLDLELNSRKKDIFGIINGLDNDFFNPQTDKLIYNNFSSKTIAKKVVNKSKLQKELNWPDAKNTPLLGVVTRLYKQKGIDWLANIVPQLAKLKTQIVILGTGDKTLEKKLKILSKKYPNNFKVVLKFDAALAQKIYAASDIFLVPSRFEPCGLTQMIAMRYGAVPVVRATGGLKDTVSDYKKIKNKVFGTGFTFKKQKAADLYKTIVKALKVYNNKNNWLKLQKNCLNQDFSWQKPGREYIKLYKKLINQKSK